MAAVAGAAAGDPPEVVAVLQALAASVDWATPADTRKSATQFLEQVKDAEPRAMSSVAVALLGQNRPTYVQVFALQLLQKGVRVHWAKFTAEEHRQMSSFAFDLLNKNASDNTEWSIRSKTAAFLADIVRQEGPQVWKELLPALLALATTSPLHAEAAALVLQFLPEDVTVHNEDLEGERRRQLLLGLTTTLSQVLPFLTSLIERHFTEALNAVQQGDVARARTHAAAVTAALTSAGAYAEWAPVSALGNAKLVDACGYLLGATEFRLAACDVLKKIAARRKQQDDAEAFDATMAPVLAALLAAARGVLGRVAGASAEGELDEEESEFGERVCEALSALAPTNLHRVMMRDEMALPQFLQVMMEFFNHRSFALHSLALPVWTAMLRESAIAQGVVTGTATPGLRPPKDKIAGSTSTSTGATAAAAAVAASIVIPPEVCASLLETVVRHLPRQGGEGGLEDEFPLGSTSSDFTQYRSRLLEVARLTAAQQPLVAAAKVAAALEAALAMVVASGGVAEAKVVAALGATLTFLETSLAAVPEPTMAAAAAFSTNSSILRDDLAMILEGMLQQLLSLDWTRAPSAAVLVEFHAHLLDSLGPYCRHNPTAAALVVDKLFALVASLPRIPLGSDPLGRPEKAEDKLPRLQVCTSILRLCRTADRSLVPHMQSMVGSITALRQGAQPTVRVAALQGEDILLGEGLLCVAAAAGQQEEAMAFEWVFTPVRERWTNVQWQQQYLADPSAFIRLLTYTPQSEGEADFWFLYHSLMLLERCLRKPSAASGLVASRPGEDQAAAGARHPVAAHLAWIMPPLVQVIRCLHSLWVPSVRSSLPPAILPVLDVGEYEKTVLLGEAAAGLASSSSLSTSSSSAAAAAAELRDTAAAATAAAQPWSQQQQLAGAVAPVTDANAAAVITRRNWLKGIRDNGYGFLGLAAGNATAPFFAQLEAAAAQLQAALYENLGAVEQRHLKLLLKLVVLPIARSCPRDRWPVWVGALVSPVLVQCGTRLVAAWAARMQAVADASQQTAAAVNAGGAQSPALKKAAVREEMYEEKVLRDFSREFCNLLAALTNPPSAVTATAAASAAAASAAEKDAGATDTSKAAESSQGGAGSGTGPYCVFQLLLRTHPDAAAAAVDVGIKAIDWPDTDSAHKALNFCAGVVALPELTSTSTTGQLQGQALQQQQQQQQQPGIDPLPAGLLAQLLDAVGRVMFSAAIQALTLESNAAVQADILSLLRDIYMRLSPVTAAPWEVLLSLPGVAQETLANFQAALLRTGSAKEQRSAFRQLLQGVGGSALKALAAQKSSTTITNVSYAGESRRSADRMGSNGANRDVPGQDGDAIGLASLGSAAGAR